jgi:hypothetical protein
MLSSSEQIGRVRSTPVKLPEYDAIGEEIVPRIEPYGHAWKPTYAETDWEVRTCLKCEKVFESQGRRLCDRCNDANSKQSAISRLMGGGTHNVRKKFLGGDPISPPD